MPRLARAGVVQRRVQRFEKAEHLGDVVWANDQEGTVTDDIEVIRVWFGGRGVVVLGPWVGIGSTLKACLDVKRRGDSGDKSGHHVVDVPRDGKSSGTERRCEKGLDVGYNAEGRVGDCLGG